MQCTCSSSCTCTCPAKLELVTLTGGEPGTVVSTRTCPDTETGGDPLDQEKEVEIPGFARYQDQRLQDFYGKYTIIHGKLLQIQGIFSSSPQSLLRQLPVNH